MGHGKGFGRGLIKALCFIGIALLLGLYVPSAATAASPLECGMKQMGVRGHIDTRPAGDPAGASQQWCMPHHAGTF